MARPAGVAKATKDNSNKHPQQAKEFREGKKIGRPKQRWVWDNLLTDEDGCVLTGSTGHWEATNG